MGYANPLEVHCFWWLGKGSTSANIKKVLVIVIVIVNHFIVYLFSWKLSSILSVNPGSIEVHAKRWIETIVKEKKEV